MNSVLGFFNHKEKNAKFLIYPISSMNFLSALCIFHFFVNFVVNSFSYIEFTLTRKNGIKI
ncbi:MAG: hypothetical protein KBF99_11680 [Leptospiraceae bacterium]|nr:hypothetical protein [Leptospiraceae bacterium]MBK7057796.1 hypothetical protein [Leptospiraceae bacterium]MBP9163835.1 hypothetical protein [Leptospiraceae bacterium]